MSVLVHFNVVPLGSGASLSTVIARVLAVVEKSGIAYKATPMGTVLEGSWDEVMDVVRRCHDEARREHERVLTSISIDDRAGPGGRMERKLVSVEEKLGHRLRR